MKKYLILAVVTLLAVLLSACSGNVKSNNTSAENTTVQYVIHSAYRILVWNKDWSDSSYCIWSFAVIT